MRPKMRGVFEKRAKCVQGGGGSQKSPKKCVRTKEVHAPLLVLVLKTSQAKSLDGDLPKVRSPCHAPF